MRPFGALLTFDEALATLLELVEPLHDVEEVALLDALGRVAARDVRAAVAVPPFDRAAMDGYAVRAADVAGATDEAPVRLLCVGHLYAGGVEVDAMPAGACREIATGAPLPPGADAVVMVEHTAREGDEVLARSAVRLGQHVTRRGADMQQGDRVLAAGARLTPARIGALAAVGLDRVACWRRPRVAIGATGSEIVPPGVALEGSQIHDVNTWSLAALCQSLGCEVTVLPPTPDDEAALEATLERGLAADLVVLSGGSSVGEKDLLQDVCRRMGSIAFHGVAIKPGKPTMLATIRGRPVLGMPGYPTSCLSNGYMFLVPALCRMAGAPPPRAGKQRLPAAGRLQSMADKHHVITVRVDAGQALSVFKESGTITSMSLADGFVEVPTGCEAVEAGDEVEVTWL